MYLLASPQRGHSHPEPTCDPHGWLVIKGGELPIHFGHFTAQVCKIPKSSQQLALATILGVGFASLRGARVSHIALLHIPYLSWLAVGLHSLQWGILWMFLVLRDSQNIHGIHLRIFSTFYVHES